ncbi:hypothetical protein [Caulobacter sp. RL271]|jgi:hypothetical protein|uniref:Uncharacterized protein n=1 Tax=Caulobacter segnis TaxID=88688 RepID=A0ABY4ZQI8_9CAUL|nr:hypothetical protein [Caulobacter segnis]USQ94940.1 hypothetical protein MZV50_20620 [Caulobacter segnis]
MKLGILLCAAIVSLFAGLANLWFGDVSIGVGMVGVFCAIAGFAAWMGKRDYDARPVEPPAMERGVVE